MALMAPEGSGSQANDGIRIAHAYATPHPAMANDAAMSARLKAGRSRRALPSDRDSREPRSVATAGGASSTNGGTLRPDIRARNANVIAPHIEGEPPTIVARGIR